MSQEAPESALEFGRRRTLGVAVSHTFGRQEPKPKPPQVRLSAALEAKLGTRTGGVLPYQALQLLLFSISVPLSVADTRTLKSKAVEIGRREDGSIDFSDFLLIMRWILDGNLCNISQITLSGKAANEQDGKAAMQIQGVAK